MTDLDTDASIEAQQETVDVNQEAENQETPEPQEETQEEAWPKKAENALSRQKKENNKLRAEMRAMQEQLQKLQTQPSKDSSPKEEDFESYGDFVRAQAVYDAQKKVEEILSQRNEQTQQQQQQQAFIAQREQEIQSQAQELGKSIPDFFEVMNAHSDEMDALPPQIAELFYMADNPSLAAYNLIQEGKIERLAYMHPQLAAAEIVRAQNTPYAPKKPSAAPAPMSAAKGTGQGAQSLSRLSPDELVQRLAKLAGE